jgi:flavin-dependent dehydrogenase
MNIAIVGAGPVGIYFAKLCIDKGYKVTLIESENLNGESSHLSRKKYVFPSPSAIPEGVHKIGGGSTQWRGRISEFLPEDFRLKLEHTEVESQKFHSKYLSLKMDCPQVL